MLRRLNKALPGLVLGIIVYGVLLQVTGIWFVDDRLRYSTDVKSSMSLKFSIDTCITES